MERNLIYSKEESEQPRNENVVVRFIKDKRKPRLSGKSSEIKSRLERLKKQRKPDQETLDIQFVI